MVINHRLLYVDVFPSGRGAASVMGVGLSDPDYITLKNWCNAKSITGIKWYCDSFSSGQMANLRLAMEDMRSTTTVQDHSFISNNISTYPQTSVDLTVNPFGYKKPNQSDSLSSNGNQRFFTVRRNSGYDLEYEFYGMPNSQSAFDTVWKPRVENGAVGLDFSYQGAGFSRKDGANTSYLGWFKDVVGVADTIVKTHTRIDLHAYTNFRWGTGSLGRYGFSRYDDLAYAQAKYILNGSEAYFSSTINQTVPENMVVNAGYDKFTVFPIFSFEAANYDTATNTWNHLSPVFPHNNLNNNFAGMFCYSGSLAGDTPIVGLDLTFDELFNCYLSGNKNGTGTAGGFKKWQSDNLTGNERWIQEPDGYVLFEYSLAYAARPSTSTP